MNFLIFGAGALGQAIGCMLAADGHHVDFILRPRFIEQISRDGLMVTGILGDFSAPGENFTMLQGIGQAVKHYDYVLLTTKAYDTAVAIRDIATLGDRAAVVVSMQNGCGNVELVESRFGREKSLGARVITGFAINRPGRITITVSADAIHVGGSTPGTVPESARLLAGMINKAGHPALAVADIHQSLFAKLLYNCALNPLGAILGVHYGALAERLETRQVMNQVIDETFTVITALGGTTPWPNAESYKEVFYRTLVPATYHHRASMLQDLEHGKRTEVDALVGYVGEQGKRLQLPTPACDLLTALMKFKEAGEMATSQGAPTFPAGFKEER
jgi:2-dehydropantoate 2-reductase